MAHASYNYAVAEASASEPVPALFWALLAATVLASASLIVSSMTPSVQPFLTYFAS